MGEDGGTVVVPWVRRVVMFGLPGRTRPMLRGEIRAYLRGSPHKGNASARSQRRVFSVAFSPDGAFLATGDGSGTIRVWNLIEGCLQAVLQGHERAVWSVAFAPDGQSLASASHDGTVKLWELGVPGKCLSLG